MAYDSKNYLADQEKNIRKQFSTMRTGLQARIGAQKNQAQEDLNKQFKMNAPGTGAQAMMKQKAMANVDAGFAGMENEVGAQEAASLQAAKDAEQQRKFAASESELGRTEAARQFDVQMANWQKEFTENLQSNRINTAIALKNAGLKNERDWTSLWDTLSGMGYSGRGEDPRFGDVADKKEQEYKANHPFNPGNKVNGGSIPNYKMYREY